jgi:hypothetical protein
MGVIFTAEAEQRRTEAMQENRAKKSASWEYLTTFSRRKFRLEPLELTKVSGNIP